MWKKNDAQRIIQRKSNHTDEPAEVQRVEFRERRPRKYTKKSHDYWNTLIKHRRAARKHISYDKSDSTSQGINEDITNPQTQVREIPKNITKRKRKSTATNFKQAPKKGRKFTFGFDIEQT